MRGIFVSILPKFPKNFPRLPNIAELYQRLPNIAEDNPMTSEGCRMSRCEARNLGAILIAYYSGLKLDIKSRLLEYFQGN